MAVGEVMRLVGMPREKKQSETRRPNPFECSEMGEGKETAKENENIIGIEIGGEQKSAVRGHFRKKFLVTNSRYKK